MLVTGLNQTGKTRLTMGICDHLQNIGLNENYRIIVFDTVGHWKKLSSIPFFVEIRQLKRVKIPEHSIIFDISYLLIADQKQFIENTLLTLWNSSLDTNPERQTLLIFEEVQNFARRVRNRLSQNLMRISSVGANYKIRCLFICPTLTMIDPELTRLCNQRYHFRLGRESNILKKFRQYYGLDNCRVALNLDVGYFLYYLNGHLEVKHVNLYESETKPQKLTLKRPEKETENITQYKKSFWNRFAFWIDPEGMTEAIKRRQQREQKARVTKDFDKIDDDLEEEEDFILIIEEEDL